MDMLRLVLLAQRKASTTTRKRGTGIVEMGDDSYATPGERTQLGGKMMLSRTRRKSLTQASTVKTNLSISRSLKKNVTAVLV